MPYLIVFTLLTFSGSFLTLLFTKWFVGHWKKRKLNPFEAYLGGVFSFTLAFLFNLIVFRVSCVDFVENYEVGYKFDRRTGQINLLPRAGYYVTPPFLVEINTIDTRPMQICNNANQRVLNCKLVKYNPKGFDQLMKWHGRADYKITSGQDGSPSSFADLLKSYAFDSTGGKNCPFLEVLSDIQPTVAPAQ